MLHFLLAARRAQEHHARQRQQYRGTAQARRAHFEKD
jgi:hypothetical protein